MDETAVKRILLGFEKKVSKNQEMRIKFPDQPDKFMMSEMELHDVVRELQNVSTVPHFYPIMVELNCVSTLLGLLAHDNTDLAVAAVEVAVLDPLGGACATMTQCEVQRACARERAACDGPLQAGRGRVLGGYQQPPRVEPR